MQFLWVRWLGIEPGYTSGSRVARLPKIGFVEAMDEDVFGFLDPDLVIRGSHLIPTFHLGRVRATLLFGSQRAVSVCLRYPIPVGHCQ